MHSSRWFIYLVVFIEGFCSLGVEVIALRQIIPFLGSSIMITAPTIGFFLLALALGYQSGAKVADHYRNVVARNFLMAALLAGIGLAGPTVDWIFAHIHSSPLAYLLFIAFVLCPLAWLMGQTVPILTNVLQHARTGEASGIALYYSTLGSFLGSLTLSLLIMQWLGVSAAVGLCALLLLTGFLLLAEGKSRALLTGLAGAALIVGINLQQRSVFETAYANYEVLPVSIPGTINARVFKNNHSTASLIDDAHPPHYARYIRHIRKMLLEELNYRGKRILVLGAGGFTLSHREPLNDYLYVDIDPAIRNLAEQKFLGEPIRGEFVVDDARRFVARTDRRFDVVLVDVYSAHTSIPSHLVTREFWQSTRRIIHPDGLMIANLILDGDLATPYARNLLATIEQAYGRCSIDVLHKRQPISNVVVTCAHRNPPVAPSIYVDERNQADFDLTRSR